MTEKKTCQIQHEKLQKTQFKVMEKKNYVYSINICMYIYKIYINEKLSNYFNQSPAIKT